VDNGSGSFAEIKPSVANQIISAANGDKEKVPIFSVGETIVVRGSSFIVRNLDAFSGIVTLKLLPRNGIESLNNRVEERSAG
jgi:hypothetical protein